jgi:hypothetical protein
MKNKFFYIQKYYCDYYEKFIFRFWILGFYFDNGKL